MTKTLEIPYPDELPSSMGKNRKEFENEMRFLVSARLYELGRISSGRAAEIAGIQRADFLERLGQYKISVFNYDADELGREIQQASARSETSAE